MKASAHKSLMAAVQGGLFLAVGGGLAGFIMYPNFAMEGRISAWAAALSITTAAIFAGIIAAFSGVNTARLDFLEGKIELTDEEKQRGAQLSPPRKPMWLIPLIDVTIQWVPFAALTYAVCFLAYGQGVPRWVFIPLSAAVCGLHAALAARRNSARELLKYAAHPPEAADPFTPYVLREHVLGNAIVNLIINFIVTYAIFHVPARPGADVPFEAFIPDVLVLGFLVAVLVPIGATMQAACDIREGRAKPAARKPASHPGLIKRNAIYVGSAEVLVLITLAVLYLAGPEQIPVTWAMTIKGVVSAVIGGIAAALAAYWSAAAATDAKE